MVSAAVHMAIGGPADGSGDAAMADAQRGAAPEAAPPSAVPGPLRLDRTLRGHARAVACVKLCPTDDALLASASADKSVRLWRLGGRGGAPGGSSAAGSGGGGGDDQQQQDDSAAALDHAGGVNAVAWHPGGGLLASACDDTLVRLWDAASGKLLRTLPGHTNYAYCCEFNPSGSVLVRAHVACARVC